MAKKDVSQWQELRKKLLENFFFYRGACEIDRVAVWPKNLAKFIGVSERVAEYWLKGRRIPNKCHMAKIKAYYERLKPLPELPAETKEYLQQLVKDAEGTLQTLKQKD